MSYTELTNSTSFTSNAGEATATKVAEIISSLSIDLYTLASEETTEEQKQSILSKHPDNIQNWLDYAIDEYDEALANAIDDKGGVEELTASLNKLVYVYGSSISISASSSHQDITLFS